MPDIGERATDREFEAIRDKFEQIYRQAYSEVTQKALDFARGYAARDAKYSTAVAAGKMSKADYRAWKMGQVFQGNQWKARVQQMEDTMLNADKAARDIINGSRFEVFAANANAIGYSIERDMNANIGFTLYSAESVARLLRDEPDLLPPREEPGKDASYAWYNRQIQNAVVQGIIQGESIPKIALRIGKQTGEANMNAMLRNARTMMTGAQNAGRLEAMKQSKELGVEVQKEWIATLDRRTRSSHANLDGDVADIDKPFHSELGEIMFPGDPDADPDNVWNCRCTLGYSYPDSSGVAKRRDNETDEVIEDMDYHEWAAMKGYEEEEPEESEEDHGRFHEYTGDQYDEEYRLLKERIAQDNNVEDLEKLQDKYMIEYVAGYAKDNGIEYVPLTSHDKPLTEAEIITRIAGGDMTEGSCASLAYCYVAQKAGYDVLDFRGGDSRSLIGANNKGLLNSMYKNGFDAIQGVAKNYKTAGKRALNQAEEGKEYVFSCGRHAAIVRRTGKEAYEYLELQSSTRSGWHSFTKKDMDSVLEWRFGANIGGMGEVKSTMVSVDDMAKSDRVLKIMGYINTEEDKQHKGASGHER